MKALGALGTSVAIIVVFAVGGCFSTAPIVGLENDETVPETGNYSSDMTSNSSSHLKNDRIDMPATDIEKKVGVNELKSLSVQPASPWKRFITPQQSPVIGSDEVNGHASNYVVTEQETRVMQPSAVSDIWSSEGLHAVTSPKMIVEPKNGRTQEVDGRTRRSWVVEDDDEQLEQLDNVKFWNGYKGEESTEEELARQRRRYKRAASDRGRADRDTAAARRRRRDERDDEVYFIIRKSTPKRDSNIEEAISKTEDHVSVDEETGNANSRLEKAVSADVTRHRMRREAELKTKEYDAEADASDKQQVEAYKEKEAVEKDLSATEDETGRKKHKRYYDDYDDTADTVVKKKRNDDDDYLDDAEADEEKEDDEVEDDENRQFERRSYDTDDDEDEEVDKRSHDDSDDEDDDDEDQQIDEEQEEETRRARRHKDEVDDEDLSARRRRYYYDDNNSVDKRDDDESEEDDDEIRTSRSDLSDDEDDDEDDEEEEEVEAEDDDEQRQKQTKQIEDIKQKRLISDASSASSSSSARQDLSTNKEDVKVQSAAAAAAAAADKADERRAVEQADIAAAQAAIDLSSVNKNKVDKRDDQSSMNRQVQTKSEKEKKQLEASSNYRSATRWLQKRQAAAADQPESSDVERPLKVEDSNGETTKFVKRRARRSADGDDAVEASSYRSKRTQSKSLKQRRLAKSRSTTEDDNISEEGLDFLIGKLLGKPHKDKSE